MNHTLARRCLHPLVQLIQWQQRPKQPRMPAIEKQNVKIIDHDQSSMCEWTTRRQYEIFFLFHSNIRDKIDLWLKKCVKIEICTQNDHTESLDHQWFRCHLNRSSDREHCNTFHFRIHCPLCKNMWHTCTHQWFWLSIAPIFFQFNVNAKWVNLTDEQSQKQIWH